MIAIRLWLGDGPIDPWLVDAVLAITMVGYNYAASRYVVGVAAARQIVEAMERVDLARAARVAATRNTVLRVARRTAVRLNPFNLVKWAGGLLGRSADDVSARIRHRQLRRVGSWVEDLGAVNVMGVPGAGLALVTSGRPLSRAQSMRHCVLFVGSWFTGAHLVAAAVGGLHTVPALGETASAVTGATGTVFTTLTDPTRPVGAIAISAVVASVVHYAAEVQAELARGGSAPSR